MRCLACHYDLRNLSTGGEHRCPECGRHYDPSVPSTFDDGTRRRLFNALRKLLKAALTTFLLLIVLCFVLWILVLIAYVKQTFSL